MNPLTADLKVEEPSTDMVWGARMFLQTIRSRILHKSVCEDQEVRSLYRDKDWTKLPSAWNTQSDQIALLGPTGAGKSSLIYTLWRAINDVKDNAAEMSRKVETLEVGWTLDEVTEDNSKASTPQAKHGTRALAAIDILEATTEHGGIKIYDTKGQQFFDNKEISYADSIVSGLLEEGSTVEDQNLKYWLMIGNTGFFKLTSLQSTPHVLLLVFDASLKSLNRILNANFEDPKWQDNLPQLVCYHKVIKRAYDEGMEVFICLTHMDVYERQHDASATNGRVGEGIQPHVDSMIEKLSKSLSYRNNYVGADHIFVVENYRRDRNTEDARIELAAVELLEALLESADNYVASQCPKLSKCSVS